MRLVGRRRYAVQEGVHSILANRFGLLKGRQRVKYLEEVELRTAMTFCALHGIAYARAKRAQAPQSAQMKVAAVTAPPARCRRCGGLQPR
jgi:hypothetical protein